MESDGISGISNAPSSEESVDGLYLISASWVTGVLERLIGWMEIVADWVKRSGVSRANAIVQKDTRRNRSFMMDVVVLNYGVVVLAGTKIDT